MIYHIIYTLSADLYEEYMEKEDKGSDWVKADFLANDMTIHVGVHISMRCICSWRREDIKGSMILWNGVSKTYKYISK